MSVEPKRPEGLSFGINRMYEAVSKQKLKKISAQFLGGIKRQNPCGCPFS